MDKIAQEAITRLFDRHRIVFWYDEKRELRPEYESLSLSSVEKIELRNNEYAVK
jgi:tRNA G10  N-methylase Trm11